MEMQALPSQKYQKWPYFSSRNHLLVQTIILGIWLLVFGKLINSPSEKKDEYMDHGYKPGGNESMCSFWYPNLCDSDKNHPRFDDDLRGRVYKGQVELFMWFAVRVDAYMLLPANLGVVAPVIPSGIFPWQFLLELDVFLYIKKSR